MLRIMFLVSSLMATSVWAADQVGTLTQIEGDVKIFSNPSKSLPKDMPSDTRPRALFQGEYYRVQTARIGDRVDQGNILRTPLAGKARVVFDNGDQFYVGPGTSYRIFWDQDSSKAKTTVNLVYGKLRGVIEKGGPRSHLQVRTKAVTMGVRGTEFFIAENGADGETEISIIRGAVEVKPVAEAAKPVEVKSGYSATISAAEVGPEVKKVEPVVELRRTTQEDLIGISKASIQPGAAAVPKEISAKLDVLEKKALSTTLKDIRTYDPKLYAKFNTQSLKSADQVNAMTVQTLMETAPKAPPKRKPYKSELEDLEQGAYEKYFKIVE